MNGPVTITASAVVRAWIGPSTATICPEAVCTGLPSSDSTRQRSNGALPGRLPFRSVKIVFAAVKTSIDPATPEARMPSYTHILICGMVMSDIAVGGAILPPSDKPDKQVHPG